MSMELKEFLNEREGIAAAFSGGADSAYLAYAASLYAKRAEAFFVKTPFQPIKELDRALEFCRANGIRLHVLCVDTLSDADIAANGPERCYYCKRRIFSAIKEAAERMGLKEIADGSNASDDPADRPGMRALEELGVLSPFIECGLTKDDIRRLSREAGLSSWDKPSDSCLATRQEPGMPIRIEGLKRTEEAESRLRALGFSGFRVRTRGENARLEIAEGDIELLDEKKDEVVSALSSLYDGIEDEIRIRK